MLTETQVNPDNDVKSAITSLDIRNSMTAMSLWITSLFRAPDKHRAINNFY